LTITPSIKRFLLLISLFALNSCDLLKTRDPEAPLLESTSLPPATSPEQAVQNFQMALQQRDVQEYEKLFSDSVQGGRTYIFIPARNASVVYASLFGHWSRDSEREWFRNVLAHLSTVSAPTVAFDQTKLTKFQSDSALFEARYTLTIPHQETALPIRFSGSMFLVLAPTRTTGLWSAYRWEDLEASKDSSWSMAKGYFGR
jgi:hypothetical protein